MNPQQYPPQPGQMPGYPNPGGPGGPVPQGPSQNPYGQYPAAPPAGQPGQWRPPMPPGPAQPGYGPAGPQAPPTGGMPTSGYNPYAFPGEYDKPQAAKGPNKGIIIGGIAVLLVIIIIAVLASMSSGGNTPPDNTTQTQTGEQTTSNAGNDVVPRSDSTLDLSKKINNKDTLKAQLIKAKTGEQVNLSSGFSFMVSKTETYTSPNPATLPAAGKKFIVITAVVGNRNESANISVSYLDFRLRDANNQLLPGSGVTNELLNNPLASPSEIKPGQQVTGKIVFEVAANDTTWTFKHSETYQKTTDDTTFTVEGEITAQLATAGTTTP